MASAHLHRWSVYWAIALVLFAVVLLMAPGAVAAQAQYRETDSEFLRRLSERLDAAEARAAPNLIEARKSANESARNPSAEKRIPATLRHKSRAHSAGADKAAGVKVKFPWLRDEVQKARARIEAQQRALATNNPRRIPTRKALKETERQVFEIERRLAEEQQGQE